MENNEDVKRFYQDNYDEDVRADRESLEILRTKSIIARYLSGEAMEIADVCGATGIYSFWLAGMGHRVHLLDLAQNHIEIAKSKARQMDIDLASYTCADARQLPYADGSMDVVLLMGALYHLRSREARMQCLSEAFRVLKRGGRLMCTVINRYMCVFPALKYNLMDEWDIDYMESVLKSGAFDRTKLPLAYCHTPSEIVSEASGAGFARIQLVAVEGIANALGTNQLPEDEKTSAYLLRCIELTESIPELLGVTRNIIAVCNKV